MGAKLKSPRILIAGASGFIGRALTNHYREAGVETLRLVRRPPTTAEEIFWDPAKQSLDAAPLGPVDAIINLAGENISEGRWTAARREQILLSRVDATRTLVPAMAGMTPKPSVFLSASAAGYYGDRDEE